MTDQEFLDMLDIKKEMLISELLTEEGLIQSQIKIVTELRIKVMEKIKKEMEMLK